LIAECKTIGTINLELIARINQIGDETTQFKNYYVQKRDEPDQGLFFVEEVIEELPRSSLLENWKKVITLKKPVDLFNDKLNYNCATFQDICRLNESMLGVIDKFLFLDPKRAQSELAKFKVNFEILQQCLGEVEGSFHNVNEFSKLKSYQGEVEDINQRIKTIFLNPDVIWGPRMAWAGPCSSHTVNKNRALQVQSVCGCVLSTRGYSSGVHKFTIRVITRPSTCMLGVAPNTVSKTAYNYNSNGFFMNLADGSLYSGAPFSYSNRQCLGKGVPAGGMIILTLDCNKHTLTYNFEGRDFLAYENLPNVKLFLAFDNDTSAGSELEIV
jgi:hypothetical protein